MAGIAVNGESHSIAQSFSHRRNRSNSWTPINTTWTTQHGQALSLRPSASSPVLNCSLDDLVTPEPIVEEPTMEVTLSDLLEVIRKDVQHRRRANSQRTLLCRRQQAHARGRNVAALSYQVKSTLTDCIRADDKASFTTLYTAAIETSREDDLLEWHDKLTATSRVSLTAYLVRLREKDFLADCIAGLSQQQLLALLPHKNDSVLASRNALSLGFTIDRLVDDLAAGSASCALDAIWNLLGYEDHALDVWATVCAKLISEQRLGGDKVMTHIMNRLAASETWTGRLALEDWMLDTIEGGRFLLEQPKTFSQRMQMPQAGRGSDNHRNEQFLLDAASSLLELLGQPSMVPKSVLSFASRIMKALTGTPRHQNGLPSYIATRWLFLSWLQDVLSQPEVHGLLQDHIVTDHIRQRILRDVCSQAQRIAVDSIYAWKHNRTPSGQDSASVQRILALFAGAAVPSTAAPEEAIIAIAAEDVIVALTSLHPVQRIGSISDQATLRSGLQSSASSISGFSLFRSGNMSSGDDLSIHDTTVPHNLDAIDSNLGTAKEELEDIVNAYDKSHWSFFLQKGETLQYYEGCDAVANHDQPGWWTKVLDLIRGDAGSYETDGDLQCKLGSILNRFHEHAHQAGDLIQAYQIADLLVTCRAEPLASLHHLVQQSHTALTRSMSEATKAIAHAETLALIEPDAAPTADIESLSILRDKMWYKASVRTSAEFEQLQALFSALKQMSKPLGRARSNPLRSNAQVLAILSVTPEHGGPNKLTSEQSVIVQRWLQQNHVQVLCTIDERIHKLCMEVRKAAESLCASDITSNPMLWEDALYKRAQPSVLALPVRRKEPRPAPTFWSSQRSIPQALSNTSSYEYIDAKSPTSTNKSSSFWSPAVTETLSQSSATSVGSQGWPETWKASHKPETQFYSRIVGYLQSEFSLFAQGSETDEALWTGLGATLQQEQHLLDVTHAEFSFHTAFRMMWRRLSTATNPLMKLQSLVDIQKLLPAYMKDTAARTTSLADRFYTVLSDPAIRPPTLLRDLQYIAALLPQASLEDRSTNNAFWNAALAAARLKDERVRVMVEVADSIIDHQTNSRGSSSVAQHQRDAAVFAVPQPRANIDSYKMSDAAHLLQIAARDGNAAAQRELATLYLTHPDLIEHVIAPFAQAKEVFREELENKWKTQDRTRCDPLTMCVAHHWMMLSSKGGDTLAEKILKQTEEMDRLG